MCPVGTSPMPEVHFNIQNNNKKFGGKKFKQNFKGKWNNNRQNYKASKGHNKEKSTQKYNSQVCQRCGCHNHNTRRCHIPGHLVKLYKKSIGKQVQGTSLKLTSLLDLLTSVAPKMFSQKTTMRRSHLSWITYSALTTCSWNSNPTTYLETPTSLHHPKT